MYLKRFGDKIWTFIRNKRLHRTVLFKYWLRPMAEKLYFWMRYYLKFKRRPRIITDVKPLADENNWVIKIYQPTHIQQREMSRTISEDAKEIVMNGKHRVRRGHQTQASHSVKRGEMYYSHLYSVTRYPIYETFICEIPGAMIVGDSGIVVTPQNEVIAQSTFKHLKNITELPLVEYPLFGDDQISGTFVSLVTPSANNYTHWIMDCLTRLDLLSQKYNQIKVIVPANPRGYQIDSLKLLGITEDRLLQMRKDKIVVERLILCHAAQRSGVPSAVHLKNIRNRLVSSATENFSDPSPSTRIWISRARSSRKIINEAQLSIILHEFGFEMVCCEDLNIIEQIQMFSSAEVVVGAHGAGMINHIFCNPGATVIEIYNKHRWEHCTCRIASLMGHDHWHIYGENRGRDWETWVDPDKLHKVLTYALKDRSVVGKMLYDDPY